MRLGTENMKRIVIITLVFLVTFPALSHDHWINRGGWHNSKGEGCCGLRDCQIIPPEDVTYIASPSGYQLLNGEFIPESETLPSQDGLYYRCAWNGERKCFFAPKPSA